MSETPATGTLRAGPAAGGRPRRLLLVSADIGEGHNATARAVEDAARRLWPDCEVSWLDTLEVMGRGVGPLFRWIYVANVESTPWLYDLFYAALWRHHWFAEGSRRFVGAWCGPRLRPLIRRARPDLVVSTYPMGTAGLDLLRRRGELEVPVAALISDVNPHPFWVYSDVDMHYVMSHASLRELHRAQPDALGAVCVPPVVPAFRDRDRRVCRAELGLAEDGFTAVISCGSFGFGSVERAVDTALGTAGVDNVVVACGHNEELRARLSRRAASDGRLVPLGWIDDMPTLTAAADVVVSNAGGATALEGLACGRTVVMFEPIAGHGRGNAEVMARAGLAELCPEQDDLAATLHRLATDPARLHEIEDRAARHSASGDFTDQVAALATLPKHRGARPLRSQDAFFLHAVTDSVPQQTGAILQLTGGDTKTAEEWADHLCRLLRHRAADLPMLRRRLWIRKRRRAAWIDDPRPDPAEHVRHLVVGANRDRRWDDAVRAFFTAAVRTDRPPWELLALQDEDSGYTAILAKLHHALGDGVVVTTTLTHLLRDDATPDPRAPAPNPKQTGTRRAAALARTFGTGVRGLASLAAAGSAPQSSLDGASSAERRFGFTQLPSVDARESARRHGVRTSVLLVTVMAEALHRLLDDSGGTARGQRLRVMVPQTTRSRAGGDPLQPGNRTVTVSVDIPVGPMSPTRRMAEIATLLETTRSRGQPVAAGAVMAALGILPDPLHAWVVRRVYQRRFFNAIVSVLPGARVTPQVAGASLDGVLPVLPLADGIGVGIGAILWGDMVGIGVTADAALVPEPGKLAEHARAAFEDLRGDMTDSPTGTAGTDTTALPPTSATKEPP